MGHRRCIFTCRYKDLRGSNDHICNFWRKITKKCWKIRTNTKKQLSLQG